MTDEKTAEPVASSNSNEMPPALEEESKEDASAASLAPSSSNAKPKANNGEMTLDVIRSICRKHKDLYDSAEINDKLFLNFQGFKRIQNMDHFPDLKSLWLENNLLTSLGGGCLSPLTSLRCLYLQNNMLGSLEGVECLAGSLVLLNVSSNALTNLAGVAQLKHLQILDAHENKIRDVDELRNMAVNCRALHTIDLSQNLIEADLPAEEAAASSSSSSAAAPAASNAQPVPRVFDLLAAFPSLKVVYLKLNPVVESVGQYRRLLSSMVANLSFLDDRPVSDVDRACARAWRTGGTNSEKQLRLSVRDEQRAKEERNMIQWRKQKDERIAQLAALAAEEKEAAASHSSAAASSASTANDNDDIPSESLPANYVKRLYHRQGGVIPASAYHGPLASAEYSSWLLRQEDIEKDDEHHRETEKKMEQAQLNNKKKANAATSTPAAAAPVAAAAPADPLPTSSYFSSDSSDDPEIVAMKQMLHDVLLSTQTMTTGGAGSGGPGSAPRKSRGKRSHNIGVSEAAIVEVNTPEQDAQAQMDEEEEEARAFEQERKEAEEAVARANQANLVAVSSRPSTAVAAAGGDVVADLGVEEATTDGAGETHAPNLFSILDSESIAQIYEATKLQLPSVAAHDDDEEDDVTEDDVTEDEEELEVPVVVAGVPSPSKRRSFGMPKLVGFGPDDAHLIDRPLMHEARGTATTNGSSTSRKDLEQQLANAAAHHDDDDDEEFWRMQENAIAASSSAKKTAVAPTKSSNSTTLSLSALLEQRKAARLGSAGGAMSRGKSSSGNSRSSSARPVSAAVPSSSSASAAASLPSTRASGVTAESLLHSFIQAQATTPAAAAAPASADGDADSTAAAAAAAAQARVSDLLASERSRKLEMFSAASSALDAAPQTRTSTLDSDDDDDDDEDGDDGPPVVDARAAAADARRIARQQQQQQQQ